MPEEQLSKKDKKLMELALAGGGDKELALFEQMNELEDKFDATVEEIKKNVPDLDKVLETIKGRDGKDGESILGETGAPGELGPEGPKGKDGRDGKDGKEGRDGRDGTDGRDGVDGADGKDGTNGNDGSPDTPDEVIQKINKSRLLINKDRIDGLVDSLSQMVYSAVGITTTIFFKNGIQVGRAKNINFTGTAVSSVTVLGDTAQVSLSGGSGGGQVNSIVAGSNIIVDATDPANPVVSATGGGSFAVMVPTGTVDGSNKSFVFSSAPSVIVVDDGSTMNKTRKDGQANWSGTTTVVMTVSPNGNIFGY